MKHILTITDKEITGSDMLSSALPRIAVNAVLFDNNNNIALSYMGKYDLHTLPGGGVEPGEDFYTAVKREVWEEAGCECKIIGELGQINENRSEHDFTQERFYYIARVDGEKGSLHLTDEEIEAGTMVIWISLEQALKIISEKEHDNYQRKFIQKRDIAVLEEALIWRHTHDISGYDTFVKIEPIAKGWSGDEKYCVETIDGQRLFLRISDIAEYTRKKVEYNMMERVYASGVLTPKPVEFGLCDGGKSCYSLSGWIEGEDLASVLASMTETEKYAMGIKSGILLQKMHSIPAPNDVESWSVRFQRKIDERMSNYYENNGKSENGELVIKYLRDNADMLNNRFQKFNHGDFNTTNIIVSAAGELGVTDFNCFTDMCDYGDPLWDISNGVLYMELPDPYYYTGLWNGYSDGKPDKCFFDMTAYYFAYEVLSSLGGDEHFDNYGFDKKVISWYDNMKTTVPTWYLKDFDTEWRSAESEK